MENTKSLVVHSGNKQKDLTLYGGNSLSQLFPANEISQLAKNLPKNDTPLWDLWNEYVEEMEILKRSKVSMRSVRDSLQSLVRHGEILTLKQLTTKNIREYLRKNLEERKWKPETYNTKISKLGSFFKFLVEEEYIENNPIKNLQKISRQKENHYTLSPEEFNQLIGHIVIQKRGLIMLRDTVFFMLLGLIGCRRSEALQIELSNINLKKQTLLLHGVKGAKSRMLRLDSRLCDAIEEYLRYREKLKRTELYLFISSTKRGKPWTASGVRKSMERLSKELKFKLTCHAFRRFAATTLAEQNVQLEKIMQLLGHTSMRTTLTYIQTCSPRLLDSCTNALSKALTIT